MPVDPGTSTDAPAPSPSRGGEDIRRVNAEALGSLATFAASPWLAKGQISLISLDAIADRLGDRWANRRQSVYDYTERALGRYLGEDGHFLQVSDTDFLVAAPSLRKFAAQLRCFRCLRDILTHFLGEPRPADLVVREVTTITKDGLEAALVDPVAAAVAAERERAQDDEDTGASVDRWAPFVASNGRRIRVSCVLEPVYELRSYTRIGNHIVRRVLHMDTEIELTPAELLALSRADIERIDCATIARGLDRMRSEQPSDQPLSLIIPVSYISLSTTKTRAALARLFAEAKELVKTGIICEVCDIEGVPQGALLAATSLIKPFCVLLVGRLNISPDRGLRNLRSAGLQAISFDAPGGVLGDAEFQGWARAAIKAAKAVAKPVLIYRLGSLRHAGMVGLLGASHATLRTGAQAAA
jgi:hypothetical protein